MKNIGKFLSVGYGNVGRAVPERCADLGLVPSDYVIKSDGIYKYNAKKQLEYFSKNTSFWQDEPVMKDVRLAFLTIPSFEDGKRAKQIIKELLARKVLVVTSEKGALANFYDELESSVASIGISATVGGGTGMLAYLSSRMSPRTNQVHVVINGTLNFIMHGIAEGGTAGQVIDQAVTLGYAEPGANDHLDVLNGEIIGDIPKKTCILWNAVIRPQMDKKKFLRADDLLKAYFPPRKMDQNGLNRLISEAGSRRYIVSIIKSSEEIPETDIIAGFRKKMPNDWLIVGGFRRISGNPLFRSLKLPGPGNGAVVAAGPNESDGVYSTSGPGAGPGPTAAAMISDAARLLKV